MSIIYGLTYRNGKPVSQSTTEYMRNKLSSYKLDALRSLNVENGIFWCGAQNITPESLLEELPCYGTHNRFALTADAILDNRKDLLYIFNIPKSEWNTTTDSDLIMLSYNKWKEDCPKYLVGDFAFVIWDTDRREIFGARDHVGKRTFYYHNSNGLFAFCTVMKPLLQLESCSNKLNNNWIADYLSLSSLIHEIDCTQTIYEDIQQLLPGHYFKLNIHGMTIKRYWNPKISPEIKYKRDEEYIEAFNDIFFEAVKCRLRSNGSIGVMLSGGLDSSSVAAVAAKLLSEKNKSLKAYSFIPYSGYNDWLPKHLIANEREYIEEIASSYKNVNITYSGFDNMNAVSNIDELLDIIEQPYKIVSNFFWADRITKEACEAGCKVLLDGQYGNLTISAGDMYSYLLALCRKGRLMKYITSIDDFSNLHHLRFNKVFRYYTKLVLPDFIIKTYCKIKKNEYESINQEDVYSFVNPEFAENNNVEERLKRFGYGSYQKSKIDMYGNKKQANNIVFLSQAGCTETKLSLHHGILKRDPTRDKRIIEFCMGLPIDQFVNKGQDRSIVRRGLSGTMPDKIRLNYSIRGKQSADFVQRLNNNWPDIKNELEMAVKNNVLRQYIDSKKISNVLCSIGNYPKDQDYLNIQMLINCLVFCRFIVKERR